MEKIAIYPFNANSFVFAKYQKNLKQYDVAGFIEYEECDSDVVRHQYAPMLGMDILIGSVKCLVKQADTILLLEDPQITISKYQFIINNIKKYKKKLLITKGLYDKLDTDGLNEVQLLDERIELGKERNSKFVNIDIPTIAIMSVGEECNKFDMQICAQDFFVNKGYKVLQFGTKEYSKLFNMYTYPDFLFAEQFSYECKILMLNHYIRKMLKQNEYDLLILGVPGGILPINDRFPNHFAEIPKIIAEAAQLDINIISIYYQQDKNMDIMEYVSAVSKYVYKCDTNYFNISNVQLKYSIDEGMERVDYYYLDPKYIDIPTNSNEYKISCCFTGENIEIFFETILNELIENIEII